MKHKRFEFYRNWHLRPECGYYGFIRIFSNSVSNEGKEKLREWLDHLGDDPVFPED